MTLAIVVVLAALWLVIAALLLLELAGIRRFRAGSRLLGFAILLCLSAPTVSLFGQYRAWSNATTRTVSLIMFLPELLGIALVGIWYRTLRRRSSPPPVPGSPDR